MQLDRLAVVLRPRGGWEALDLGFQMAREWWRPIWAVWFALYLPTAAVILFVLSNRFHAVLVLWWLKPLFDRAVLHTASRAVFGETPGVIATLRAAREWLRPGLIAALTFSRFNLARSFTLPVSQLEKQTGAKARHRRRALGGRMRSYGVWLTVVCVHLEAVAMFGLVALAAMLVPAGGGFGRDDGGQDFDDSSFWEMFSSSWSIGDVALYLAAVSLIEPAYVAAGFALYLNRRAILEGWDIELSLRQLEERLRAATAAVTATLIAGVVAGLVLLQPPAAIAAEAAGKSAPAEIRKVLELPEFSQHREVTRWRYLGEDKKREERPFGFGEFWRNLSLMFGDFTERLLWVVAAVLLALALFYLRRFVPEPRLRNAGRYRPPEALFGLDVTPESLPGDVAAAAAQLARQGRLREALSLLYRGALSALVHRHRLPLAAGDTEGDCVRAAGQALPQPGAEYFSRLVRTWQAVAYAGRAPEAAGVEALCQEWRPYFSPPAAS